LQRIRFPEFIKGRIISEEREIVCCRLCNGLRPFTGDGSNAGGGVERVSTHFQTQAFFDFRLLADILPDPFDGLLITDAHALTNIHTCLGCPLRVDEKLVGVLTADALNPRAFDHLDQRFLTAVGALAGAQMQTAYLIDALELRAQRQGEIATDLMQDIFTHRGHQMIGNTPVMTRLQREIELVARSDFTVLILGETGVGKELVARAIHKASRRTEAPMLYLNCAALPETLAESELFGHVKGAFTGAGRDSAGKFELANGGTLFLDEVGELPFPIQAKLLRVIQEGEIQRVGADQTITVDVRLLAATNRNLEEEVLEKRFRSDLYHRLNVYPITVPALRDRKEDIPLLSFFFAIVPSVGWVWGPSVSTRKPLICFMPIPGPEMCGSWKMLFPARCSKPLSKLPAAGRW